MTIKIGVLTHSRKDQYTFKELEKQLDVTFLCKVGVLDYAVPVAVSLEKMNAEALIATSATAAHIKNHVGIPVIPLYVRNENLLDALLRAKQMGGAIAFADINKHVLYDIDRLADLLECDIKRYPFNHLDETEQVVADALGEGRQVMVTQADCMASCASRNGLPSVIVPITRQDIVDAVEHAKILISLHNKQMEKISWLTAVIDNYPEGVILTDSVGEITLLNDSVLSALSLTKEDREDLKRLRRRNPLIKTILDGKEEFEVIPTGEQQVVVTRQKISSDSRYFGSLIRINVFNELQKSEMRARQCVAGQNGFTTKISFNDIIGESPSIKESKRLALHYARSMANILILGESGVGKEMFAQSIHNASPASDGPFVAINCATLTETLLDSELFGYEDGAFTGAKKGGKAGLFEVAHGGTIFLDEIGEMPLFLQAKLLRVLQERSVRRLGGNKNIPIDVRMIFATNRNLVEEVKNKRFREDLYYRINVLSLKLSPLRERKEDIPLLFKNMISNRLGKSGVALAITTGQFDRLIALSGRDPDGERLMDVLLTEFAALPNQYAFEQEGGGRDRNTLTVPMGTLQEIEQSVIRQVNARLGGDKKEMERVLGISTTTLWRRLKELGLS